MLEGPQTCGTCGKTVADGEYVVWFTTASTKVTRIACVACERAERFAEYARTRRIETKTMMDALFIAMDIESVQYEGEEDWQVRARDRARERLKPMMDLIDPAIAIDISRKQVEQAMRQFEREVWYNLDDPSQRSLQSMVQASECTGMSAVAKIPVGKDRAQFLTYCSAGRCMLTIRSPKAEVTLITAEDEPPGQRQKDPRQGPMGLQGINATEEQAIALIEAVIAEYACGEIKLGDDQEVGFG